jgi:Skp1 family, tetramerisation domain
MEIPMGEVDARILAKVVEYCKFHHLGDRSADEVDRWEKEFVSVDKSTLFQLILVSLDILLFYADGPSALSSEFRMSHVALL